MLDPETAAVTFQNLAKKLIALLQKPSATTSPALPAALKALGTLGQVAPAVFAEHATSMADFVLDDLLETPVSSLSPSKAKHLKAPVEGRAGASPHQGIVLKMLGLKVSKCIPPQGCCKCCYTTHRWSACLLKQCHCSSRCKPQSYTMSTVTVSQQYHILHHHGTTDAV